MLIEAVSMLSVKVISTILGLQKMQESIKVKNIRNSKSPCGRELPPYHSSPAFQSLEMAAVSTVTEPAPYECQDGESPPRLDVSSSNKWKRFKS